MDYNKILQSKNFKRVLMALGGVIVLLLDFKAGIVVGYNKADFSHRWGDSYHRNFAGPRRGFMHDFSDRDFIDAHGTFGQIMTIDGGTLVIKGRDGVEKTVIIGESTSIMRFRDALKPEDLKTDDFVVVIGEPNEAGQIDAKFVRLMPPPPDHRR